MKYTAVQRKTLLEAARKLLRHHVWALPQEIAVSVTFTTDEDIFSFLEDDGNDSAILAIVDVRNWAQFTGTSPEALYHDHTEIFKRFQFDDVSDKINDWAMDHDMMISVLMGSAVENPADNADPFVIRITFE